MRSRIDELNAMAAGVAGKLRELMRQQRLSQRALAERSGLALSIVNEMVNGRFRSGTTIGSFSRLAEALGLSLGELFGGRQPVDDPSEQLRLLREIHARVERLEHGAAGTLARDRVADESDAIPDSHRPQLQLLEPAEALMVPLYGHAAAGLGAYNEPVTAGGEVERIAVPRRLRPHQGALMATRVTGDSMEPELMDGDVVVLHYPERQPAIELLVHGALVGVTISDGGDWSDYIKRVAVDSATGAQSLISANPAYPPLAVIPRRLRYIGTVKMTLKGPA